MPPVSRTKSTVLVTAALVGTLSTGLLAGRMLELYDASIGFEREAERIAGVLDVGPGERFGDIRAGTGRWTAFIARRIGPAGHVYATAGPTPVYEMYRTVAAAGVDNVSILAGAPGDTGRLPSQCCDGILLRYVYRSFDYRQAFNEQLFDYIRPGGRLVVIDLTDQTSPGLPSGRLGIPQVIAEVGAAGFDVLEVIEDWGRNTYCIVFERPAV